MSVTENEVAVENTLSSSETKIGDTAQLIIEKFENQLISIVNACNQELQNNRVSDVTIVQLKYTIQISSSQSSSISIPNTVSALASVDNPVTQNVTANSYQEQCFRIDENGTPIRIPCNNN